MKNVKQSAADAFSSSLAYQLPKSVFVLLFGLSNCVIASADDNPCLTQSSSMQSAQCLEEKLKTAEAMLDSSYQDALHHLPDTSDRDIRKTKEQLKKAQNAWLVYRNEHCNYMGALKGGSNIWVTIFSLECSLQETERRIDFFLHLPTSG
ncbi:lysozyme inhibitor LprI family protein [Actimicrobium sp. CCI2.3]|uniref:lysozyme inhibitor LprI family protein n=1 Tax=Actimicrobium sp. CCI2.3 TaxID=3048616 RepID=UPI002AB508E7|nr:lysozyme inhibitor LprI family protein [Actimicrobium sp. CCI2.3]MDY7574501.1 lysozyme inhibitor LprI family protein [Actimicrobium sp. CCI2.3]MEB0024160.1 DUF1311 domain-containing protein [Actimicrobium sp. CCI2.3]